MEKGTPKTLRNAIQNSLDNIDQQNKQKYVRILHEGIREFLTQHFSVAMCKYPESEQALQELFNRLTKE